MHNRDSAFDQLAPEFFLKRMIYEVKYEKREEYEPSYYREQYQIGSPLKERE